MPVASYDVMKGVIFLHPTLSEASQNGVSERRKANQ